MPIINQIVKGGGSGSVAEPYLEYSVSSGKLVSTTNRIMDFSGVTTIDVGLAGAYKNNTNISGAVDMSDVSQISLPYACQSMFEGCTGITSVDLSKLDYPNQAFACNKMFYGSGVTFADLSALRAAQQESCSSMFQNCSSLTAVKINGLRFAIQSNCCLNMFAGTGLITVSLGSLEQVTGSSAIAGMFGSCRSLESVWFYALSSGNNDSFRNMLSGDTNVTAHFPIRMQSTMSSWSNVTNGFGGTNTTVLFDLVTSLTGADGNIYARKEKESTSTATAWLYNDTLYYTSGVSNNTAGVNEPAVGDTIYSDSACTTAVTTISSIA